MKIKFSPKFVFSPNFRYQFHPDFWRDNAVVVSAPKFFTCHVTVGTATREFNYKVTPSHKTNNQTFWMTFSKILVKSYIIGQPQQRMVAGKQSYQNQRYVWHSQCLNKQLWKEYLADFVENSIKEHKKNPNVIVDMQTQYNISGWEKHL